jgi:LacI family xylobiose transport system transcriptional regulator
MQPPEQPVPDVMPARAAGAAGAGAESLADGEDGEVSPGRVDSEGPVADPELPVASEDRVASGDAPEPGRRAGARQVGLRRAVTIADIAAEAGVSVPTVSKVLNGHSSVSARTRRRIEDTIRDHGYRPRRRRTTRVGLIELVFDWLDGQWGLEIIRGVERAAQAEGLGVVVSQIQESGASPREWVREAVGRRPLGIVSVSAGLTEGQRETLATHGIPLVIVDPAGEPVHETPSVGAANWSGGYAATRHLLDLGHRRIAAIRGPENVLCARARVDGYRAAMDAASAPVDGLIRSGDFLVDDGYRQGRDLLSSPVRPTAIVAGNDLQAIGVYRAAREAGLRVPDDLSVVGFDDVQVASWVDPELTTVRQPLVEMAEAATGLVIALARGETLATTRIELSTSLVVRRSTAPLQSG